VLREINFGGGQSIVDRQSSSNGNKDLGTRPRTSIAASQLIDNISKNYTIGCDARETQTDVERQTETYVAVQRVSGNKTRFNEDIEPRRQ